MSKTEVITFPALTFDRIFGNSYQHETVGRETNSYLMDDFPVTATGSRSVANGTALGVWLAGNLSAVKKSFWTHGCAYRLPEYQAIATSDQWDLISLGHNQDVTKMVQLIDCDCYYVIDSGEPSLSERTSRKLEAGRLIDFGFSASVLKNRQADKPSMMTWVLGQIDRRVASEEPTDVWVAVSERLLDEKPQLASTVIEWLKKNDRHPRTVWYCIWLLQGHRAAGLTDLVFEVLRQDKLSEATVGAVVALRQLPLEADTRDQAIEKVFGMLATFKKRESVSEGSLEETLLAELIDTASVFGNQNSIKDLADFWVRRWSFKVRLRALAGAQSVVIRFADTILFDDELREQWDGLLEIIRSLLGAYNISNTSRALVHRAFDLFVARLGPESERIRDIVTEAPELRRRLERALPRAANTLKEAGKDEWLAAQASFLSGLAFPS